MQFKPGWFIVNMAPFTFIIPTRAFGVLLALAKIEMLPFPLPDEVVDNHVAPDVTFAVQAQPVKVVTLEIFV